MLGLLREEQGIAARVLDGEGVTLEVTRGRVEALVGRGDSPAPGRIPFTPQAKKALELALRSALSLQHDLIGTEHLLLGLAAADAEKLAQLGVEGGEVRAAVLRTLRGE